MEETSSPNWETLESAESTEGPSMFPRYGQRASPYRSIPANIGRLSDFVSAPGA